MKFNKWTLGLAAVGVVSLSSAVKAEETASTVLTAVSSTTLSGYVDTSIQWNLGTGNFNNPPYSFGGSEKSDGFNLNVVQLTLDKPLDESEWASGYHVDLWAGPDANALATQAGGSGRDFAIRQAYIALRTPLGNGIEWKIGVFDTIIGYESVASPANPNFTRSYGQTIEPQTHTGVLASYRVNDVLSLAAGIANTIGPTINGRAHPVGGNGGNQAESYKTYMGSIAITAPDSWGFLAGSTMYGGVVNGFSSSYFDNQTSWYAGATFATPVTGLRTGFAFDYLDIHNQSFGPDNSHSAWSAAVYASYQMTEKLSLHARGEYLDDQAAFFYSEFGPLADPGFKVWAFTATAQYDLWKNVLSRLEFRWDHSDSGQLFGSGTSFGNPNRKNAYEVILNCVYKF